MSWIADLCWKNQVSAETMRHQLPIALWLRQGPFSQKRVDDVVRER